MKQMRSKFTALLLGLFALAPIAQAQDFSTATNAVNTLTGNITFANATLTPVALGLSAVLMLWGIIKGIGRKAK